MKYKAVIFDLDGTLLNTIADIGGAVNSVLERHNLPVYTMEEYRFFVGKGIHNLVIQVLPTAERTDEKIKLFYQEVMSEYASNLNVRTRLFPGIAELLDQLVVRGVSLAILSNKADELMADVIKNYFVSWKFSSVFGARKNVPIKPDPSAVYEILAQLKLTNDEVLYVGDSDVDMQTATNAKLFPVGVAWGFRSKEELLANGAKKIIEKPSELLELL